jgi:hypothetical protein
VCHHRYTHSSTFEHRTAPNAQLQLLTQQRSEWGDERLDATERVVESDAWNYRRVSTGIACPGTDFKERRWSIRDPRYLILGYRVDRYVEWWHLAKRPSQDNVTDVRGNDHGVTARISNLSVKSQRLKDLIPQMQRIAYHTAVRIRRIGAPTTKTDHERFLLRAFAREPTWRTGVSSRNHGGCSKQPYDRCLSESCSGHD